MLNNLKKILFFLINIFDFKFDFPIPPKNIKRLFQISFWKTMFHIYYIRKSDEKKYKNVKNLWSEKKLEQHSYERWLLKTFRTQYGTVLNDRALKIISDNNFENIFEAGCGAGSAALVHMLRVFDIRYPNSVIKSNFKKINYVGLDLNSSRVENAKKFIPVFFNHYKDLINFDFSPGDLSNIKYSDNFFDFTFIPSVLERIDNEHIESVIQEICRVSKKYVFISDFFDHYPLGYPRNEKELSKYFNKYGFYLDFFEYKITDTYIPNQCELHTMFIRK